MQDSEHGERGMSQNQATRSRNGSWRNELCCEIVDGGGGNEAFCVGGTRGDDESDVKHTQRGSS